MTSSNSRFGNSPTSTASEAMAKQMSQSALKIKAMSQLRINSKGALALSLGKDLLLVLRYLPAGVMNKVQQFTSTNTNESVNTNVPSEPQSPSTPTAPTASNSNTSLTPQKPSVPLKIPVIENKINPTPANTPTPPTQSSMSLSSLTAAAASMLSSGGTGDKDKTPIPKPDPVKPCGQSSELYTPDPVSLPQSDPTVHKLIQENIQWQNIEARAKYLINALQDGLSVGSHNLIQHLDDLFLHIYQYPEAREVAIQNGAMRTLSKILKTHDDAYIANRTRETLAIMGHNPPTKGQGIRILAIDGGGVRGVVAVEILRMIEQITGKRTYELFDYICGVSTGSILAFLLGAHRRSLEECESMYKVLSKEIFSQNSFLGNANLMWSHAYYHTPTFEKILKKHCGEIPLISLARSPDLPRVSAISTIVNQERVVPYVFRTYALPPSVRTRYNGGCRFQMWEAVRASAAAPTYFEEFKLGSHLHQDGGILVNNPTSVALSEAKTLWPGIPLQCVMSLGNGLTMSSRTDKNMSDLVQADSKSGVSYLSWKGKFLKVLDSATDTESIHYTLNELLPPNIYFRFNPYLSEMVSMDETCTDKMEQVQKETREYLTRNIARVKYVSQSLMRPKGVSRRLTDWWNYW